MEWKLRFIRFVVRILFDDKQSFTLIRKGYLTELAREVNRYPKSKITALRILRLDGSDLKSAMKIYEDMQ